MITEEADGTTGTSGRAESPGEAGFASVEAAVPMVVENICVLRDEDANERVD